MNYRSLFVLPFLATLACSGAVTPANSEDPSDPTDSSNDGATNDGATNDAPVLGSPGNSTSTTPSQDWQKIQPCPESAPRDPIDIEDLRVEESTLHVTARHSGGCEKHTYGLCYRNEWAESYPVQIGLELLHDAQDDSCEAYLAAELSFDLTPLEEAYDKGYQTSGDQVSLSLKSFTFIHVFGDARDNAPTWDDINTSIDELNTCQVVEDCVALPTSTCERAYVNSDTDTAELQQSISIRNAIDNPIEFGCDASCECGALLCLGGKCTTQSGDCEAPPPGSQSICL